MDVGGGVDGTGVGTGECGYVLVASGQRGTEEGWIMLLESIVVVVNMRVMKGQGGREDQEEEEEVVRGYEGRHRVVDSILNREGGVEVGRVRGLLHYL